MATTEGNGEGTVGGTFGELRKECSAWTESLELDWSRAHQKNMLLAPSEYKMRVKNLMKKMDEMELDWEPIIRNMNRSMQKKEPVRVSEQVTTTANRRDSGQCCSRS